MVHTSRRVAYQGQYSVSDNPNSSNNPDSDLSKHIWIIAGICSAVVLIIIFMIIFKHKK